jgi:predicted nucleic acid-binding protein
VSVLVDSDILIEVSRARNSSIVSAWKSLRESRESILYSPFSAAEVWAGARPSEFDATTRLFRELLCAPIDYEIGELAGEFMRLYTMSHNVELPDALIAATAIQNRAHLWTRNRKHYPMKELAFY